MTLDSDHDSSDENDGKYSTDEKMTFEGLLRSSLRERADHRDRLDEFADKEQRPKSPEPKAENPRKQREKSVERDREESARVERERLSEKIAKRHVSDRTQLRIANGTTPRIGRDTKYEFARTEIDDHSYYYVVQITDQSYGRHKATLAVKDFGTDWTYTIPEFHADILHTKVAQQRREDLRADREPVAWLTDDQYHVVDDWYRTTVERELAALEDVPRQKEETIHVLDQYLIVDIGESRPDLGLTRELSSRQRDTVTDALGSLVGSNNEIPRELRTHIRESIDYPFVARIVFDSE